MDDASAPDGAGSPTRQPRWGAVAALFAATRAVGSGDDIIPVMVKDAKKYASTGGRRYSPTRKPVNSPHCTPSDRMNDESRTPMKRLAFLMVATIAVGGIVASIAGASGYADQKAAPLFGVTVPPGYRDWKVISVAHEEGQLNDIRAILGNDIAIKAYRQGKRPFPDGAIIARLAWTYTSSEENNRVFGRSQSFIAGDATNVQFMLKNSRRYSATGGWGFAQFKDGTPAEEALLTTCFPCHAPVTDRDFVFTRYAP